MLRIGAIDLGTNSIRLLIADISDYGIHPIMKKSITTRLGHRVYEEGIILQEGIERTIEAIKVYKKIMEDYGVKRSFGFATSAVRSASNGGEVIECIEEATGIKIDILSGEEEALLGYVGVSTHLDRNKPLLVVDIGGGSTEFLLGFEGRMLFRESLDLGCVRLTEKFIGENSNVVVEEESVSELRDYIKSNILDTAESILSKSSDFEIIAIGGTATTLAALKNGIHSIESSKLALKDLRGFRERIREREKELVEEINSLESGRDDIILSGIVELESILEVLKREELTVSARDALEGAVFYKMSLMQ